MGRPGLRGCLAHERGVRAGVPLQALRLQFHDVRYLRHRPGHAQPEELAPPRAACVTVTTARIQAREQKSQKRGTTTGWLTLRIRLILAAVVVPRVIVRAGRQPESVRLGVIPVLIARPGTGISGTRVSQ